jgi:hypothetical protein
LVPALFPFQLIQPDIPGHRHEEGLDAGVPAKFTLPHDVDKGDYGLLEDIFPVLQTTAHGYHVEADQFRILPVDVENNFVEVVGKNTGYNSVVGEVHSR